MKKNKTRQIITAAMVGNSLEMYDFTLFAFLSPILSSLFFPSDDKIASLIATLGTFAVGYFMRPLGAIFFGYIGDKRGRKKALTLSIILMALPTFFIGLLPTYETVGFIAPIALILLRLLQGFCAGGEYNGAGIFVVENVESHKAGFAGGMITASSAIGVLLGALVAAFCTLKTMPPWAWRGAFLFGIVVGLIGFYIRRRLRDVYLSEILEKKKQRSTFPLIEVIKSNPTAMLCTAGMAAFSGIMFYMSMSYVSIFLTKFQMWQPSSALFVMSLGILCYILLAPFTGWLSDKIGVKKVMVSGALVTLLCIYPFLVLLTSTTSIIHVIAAQLLLAASAAWFQGPMNLYMNRLFSPETRYSGLAFSYCTGMAIFGGTTPMISVGLIDWIHSPKAPAFYVIFGAIIAIVSVIVSKRKALHPKESSVSEVRVTPRSLAA